jgi:RNA polymerase sigma factor (sigma-70 family)
VTILERRTDRPARPPDGGRWEIWEQHAPAIRAYAARRVERDAVDDVVAETFAIAWRKLPRQADPLPWLYAVARRVVHGHRRSHARRGALLARVGGSQPRGAAVPDPSEQIHGDPALARAFATLTETEREAIRLVAWEGLEQDDAARAAGCTRATFAVRLSRARARLRAALEADDHEAALRQELASAAAPKSAIRSRRSATPTLEAFHDA